jgi:hypothetical protein
MKRKPTVYHRWPHHRDEEDGEMRYTINKNEGGLHGLTWGNETAEEVRLTMARMTAAYWHGREDERSKSSEPRRE